MSGLLVRWMEDGFQGLGVIGFGDKICDVIVFWIVIG